MGVAPLPPGPPPPPPLPMTGVRRHLGAKYLQCNGYFATRICRYPNSASTFQMSRLKTSGDICPNPGHATVTALKCPVCSRTIARNHRALNCESCQFKYHIKCGKVSPREYTALQTSNPLNWKCPSCILVTASKNYDQQEGPDLDITNNHSQLADIYGEVSSQLSSLALK